MRPFLSLLLLSSLSTAADVIVYGSTPGGIASALSAAKSGSSVLLVEPGRHLGGMSSGGLGWTDFGNKAAIGGMALGAALGEPDQPVGAVGAP